MKRRSVRIVVLAITGLLAVGAAIGMRTIWLPPSSLTATASLDDPGAAIVTAPGVMEMLPGPAQVSVVNPEGGPVFIARAREQDAQAWLEGSRFTTLTGVTGSRITTTDADGEDAVPDPGSSDLWVDEVTQQGRANYTWRDTTGRYLLVVATDGKPAALDVTVTWPRPVRTPWVVPLVLVGAGLLAWALGLAVSGFVRSRRRAAREVQTALTAGEATGRPVAEEPDGTGSAAQGDDR